jgi:hypothetical protein
VAVGIAVIFLFLDSRLFLKENAEEKRTPEASRRDAFPVAGD